MLWNYYPHTLKNVSKTWEFDFARRMKERKVLNPPLRTAGPMLVRESADRRSRVEPEKNIEHPRWKSVSRCSSVGKLTIRLQEPVGDVGGVVDADAHRYDQVGAGDSVHRQAWN